MAINFDFSSRNLTVTVKTYQDGQLVSTETVSSGTIESGIGKAYVLLAPEGYRLTADMTASCYGFPSSVLVIGPWSSSAPTLSGFIGLAEFEAPEETAPITLKYQTAYYAQSDENAAYYASGSQGRAVSCSDAFLELTASLCPQMTYTDSAGDKRFRGWYMDPGFLAPAVGVKVWPSPFGTTCRVYAKWSAPDPIRVRERRLIGGEAVPIHRQTGEQDVVMKNGATLSAALKAIQSSVTAIQGRLDTMEDTLDIIEDTLDNLGAGEISFTFWNATYTARNGMTWRQWCSSAYNTTPYGIQVYEEGEGAYGEYISGSYVGTGGGVVSYSGSGSPVSADDTIVDGATYDYVP